MLHVRQKPHFENHLQTKTTYSKTTFNENHLHENHRKPPFTKTKTTFNVHENENQTKTTRKPPSMWIRLAHLLFFENLCGRAWMP